MSAAHQRNYAVNAAEYLKAAKKGIEDNKSVQFQESNDNDYDRDGSSSSDGEVQTRSKTTKKASGNASVNNPTITQMKPNRNPTQTIGGLDR